MRNFIPASSIRRLASFCVLVWLFVSGTAGAQTPAEGSNVRAPVTSEILQTPEAVESLVARLSDRDLVIGQ